MKQFVLMWRDKIALDPHQLYSRAVFQSVELLHVALQYPTDNPAYALMQAVGGLARLRRLHISFHHRETEERESPDDSMTLERALSGVETLATQFMRESARTPQKLPLLEELSFSAYDSGLSALVPKDVQIVYVKIVRKDGFPFFEFQDLGAEVRSVQNAPGLHRCSIGNKKVLLGQKAGWREDMGNHFLQEKKVCLYADFAAPASQRTVVSRRREL